MPTRDSATKTEQQLEQLRRRNDELQRQTGELQIRLEEAEDALRAIQSGDIDALIVAGDGGERVFSLAGSDAVYRLIVQTMVEAACTTTTDGTILFCNSQFGRLIGMPLEQIVGRRLQDFVAPDHLAATEALLADAQTRSVKQRLVLRKPSGDWVPVYVAVNVLDQPDARSLCIVVSDLTELENSTEVIQKLRHQREALRASEEALQTAKDDLEKRVAERTADLRRTVDTLQEEIVRREQAEAVLRQRGEQLQKMAAELTLAEQRERRRLAEVLHDNLQQLLAGAKFRLDILMRRAEGQVRHDAGEVRDLLEESIECSRSLTGELSPPILHQGGLGPALAWLSEWMRKKHDLDVGVQTEEDAEPRAEGVKILLFQSARELLFNAVKHAGVDKAHVRLRRADGQIELTVSDEGVGFDPAAAAAWEARTHGGFGLVSIRERLTLLGGVLDIDSAPGRGSRVTMRVPQLLPAAEDQQRPAAVAQARASAARWTGEAGKITRILLADDHAVMREGLAMVIREEANMEIVGEASDGRTVVDLVRELQPDVVLMDISMPEMDGIEATRIIHAEHPDVCVIGLSMFEEGKVAARMKEAGAAAFLTKSGPSDRLLATIRACREPADPGR